MITTSIAIESSYRYGLELDDDNDECVGNDGSASFGLCRLPKNKISSIQQLFVSPTIKGFYHEMATSVNRVPTNSINDNEHYHSRSFHGHLFLSF
jgi:hypothetical protein